MNQDVARFLYEPVIAGLSGISLFSGLILIVGVALIYRTVREARVVAIAAESVSMRVVCGNCAWAGVVSSFAPRCPGCGAQLDRGKHTFSPPTVG